MGEFNTVDHCINYCGQESLRKKMEESPKEPEMEYLGAISKMTE